MGITEQQLMDLTRFETSSAFGDLEKLVLRYCVAITQTPVAVSDELFDHLHKHFDPQQMVELTSAIAWENYRARFNHAFGIEADEFSAGAFCPLPQAASSLTMPEQRGGRNEARKNAYAGNG